MAIYKAPKGMDESFHIDILRQLRSAGKNFEKILNILSHPEIKKITKNTRRRPVKKLQRGGGRPSRGSCDNGACNPPDCDEVYEDECGVICGDNSSCADECGVPNGDGSSCSEDCPAPGDVNGDGLYNIMEVVTLSNCILGNDCVDLEYYCAADYNQDGAINVMDIVQLVNCILSLSCGE